MKEQMQQECYDMPIQFIGQIPMEIQAKIWLLWSACVIAAIWTTIFVRVNFYGADVVLDPTPMPRIVGKR